MTFGKMLLDKKIPTKHNSRVSFHITNIFRHKSKTISTKQSKRQSTEYS